MADRLFYAVIELTLTGNGQQTSEYDVGQGNIFEITRIQQKSTGTFDIIDLADSFGNRFTNASVDKPISGQIFCDVDTDNNNNADLPSPIIVKNNGRLQITVKDTSGSGNTVAIYLQGMLRSGGK